MALDKNSNGFTFGFAIAMVVVVGALLSLAAMGLKPFQKGNIEKEKMQNILSAINVQVERDNAPEAFESYVKEQVVLNSNGELKQGDVSAFDIDIKKEYRELKAGARSDEDMNYPLFICEKEGTTYFVIPLVGTGLWGPIWGFMSIQDDYNTIYGASFDHKTETPGLGAEINTAGFQDQFTGDKVYKDGEVAFSVMKGGGGNESEYGVDGITGGTITSRGVGEMIQRTMGVYQTYFESQN